MRMKHNSSVRTQEKVSAGQVITTILVIFRRTYDDISAAVDGYELLERKQ